MQMMQVTCPQGVGPGQPIMIQGPSGQSFQVSTARRKKRRARDLRVRGIPAPPRLWLTLRAPCHQVAVPPGIQPGMPFHVQLPAAAPAAMPTAVAQPGGAPPGFAQQPQMQQQMQPQYGGMQQQQQMMQPQYGGMGMQQAGMHAGMHGGKVGKMKGGKMKGKKMKGHGAGMGAGMGFGAGMGMGMMMGGKWGKVKYGKYGKFGKFGKVSACLSVCPTVRRRQLWALVRVDGDIGVPNRSSESSGSSASINPLSVSINIVIFVSAVVLVILLLLLAFLVSVVVFIYPCGRHLCLDDHIEYAIWSPSTTRVTRVHSLLAVRRAVLLALHIRVCAVGYVSVDWCQGATAFFA
jgi:hypothetical protein